MTEQAYSISQMILTLSGGELYLQNSMMFEATFGEIRNPEKLKLQKYILYYVKHLTIIFGALFRNQLSILPCGFTLTYK